ncbi:unnamed protein product [Aspergillus oryzae]|uniref:Unnamed protein product n=1 Tax=Aspergillus oryzae var. brunneus TaxID=332754 RepID=A0ABQ6KLN8_ASPOZ|nr:unnamed protein product [Aspergillus oryzae]GMF93969.1 unnamed protein product [Aspergillus oryzae]GMG46150.1 unnamed protein product [Aspergillus oryzae var. brunneus]
MLVQTEFFFSPAHVFDLHRLAVGSYPTEFKCSHRNLPAGEGGRMVVIKESLDCLRPHDDPTVALGSEKVQRDLDVSKVVVLTWGNEIFNNAIGGIENAIRVDTTYEASKSMHEQSSSHRHLCFNASFIHHYHSECLYPKG